MKSEAKSDFQRLRQIPCEGCDFLSRPAITKFIETDARDIVAIHNRWPAQDIRKIARTKLDQSIWTIAPAILHLFYFRGYDGEQQDLLR